MSRLEDEPYENMVNDKKMEVFEMVEKVSGIIQCFNDECDYFGKMDGYIEPNERKVIKFVCPHCSTVERVRNSEAL